MIQIAWDWLHANGSITARFLVATGGLNVKRSSFVCALLARLHGVQMVSRRPIELRLPLCSRRREVTYAGKPSGLRSPVRG
jgi:hypothetical protein